MQITITDKGIKPQDVFKIVSSQWKYLAMSENKFWNLFHEKPEYGMHQNYFKHSRDKIYIWHQFSLYTSGILDLKIDYSGTPEDSLFCREDIKNEKN